MKIIKKKINTLGVKYEPEWGWFNINFGVFVFRILNGKMMIDETPYYDEHLVPIENLKIEDNNFMFDSFYKKQYTHFNLDCSTFDIGINVAKCIMIINEKGLVFNEKYDTFDFLYNENEFCIKLENTIKGERIVVSYNEYRNYFSLVYPEPGKEFLIDKCFFSNRVLNVKCKGLNLWDDKDETLNYEYKWMLNLPTNITKLSELLLNYGVGGNVPG